MNTWLYNSVAILAASDIFLQSISQNLAETVVVKDTQSLTKVKGVDPVTSSHTALFCPPDENITLIHQAYKNVICILLRNRNYGRTKSNIIKLRLI